MRLAPACSVLVLIAASGCTRPNGARCVAGRQEACACLGGGQGVQVCRPDGTYDACGCPGGDLGAAPDDLSMSSDLGTSDAGPVGQTDAHKVDLLFMVDNSSSMSPMQQGLRAQFGAMLQPLEALAADGVYVDLHIGVVTSDYGAGDLGAPGCDPSPGGQNGVLQALPSPKATNPPQGCLAPTGTRYIAYRLGPTGATSNLPNGNDAGALAAEFACMASVGAMGCGFEHPLESVYAALHNTKENAGFLRPDALLAVVFLTNEDDGSAAPNAKIYEYANDPSGTSMYGQLTTYRQTRFGVYCGGMPIPYGMPAGPLMSCAAAPNPNGDVSLEYDIHRYIDFFTLPAAQGGVKADPNDVMLVAIDAPETPIQTIFADPTTLTPYKSCYGPLSATCDQFLQHSCENNAQPAFFGDPPVRLNAVVRAAANHGVVDICGSDLNAAPDYSGALDGLAQLIRSRT